MPLLLLPVDAGWKRYSVHSARHGWGEVHGLQVPIPGLSQTTLLRHRALDTISSYVVKSNLLRINDEIKNN